MLEGEYEKIIDQFYEKISLFFQNFKNSRKTPKHFNDLVKIIGTSISQLFVWKSEIGKLYLIMLLFEQITLLKDYLVYFNTTLRSTLEECTINDQGSSRDSDSITPFDVRYEGPQSPQLTEINEEPIMMEQGSSSRRIVLPLNLPTSTPLRRGVSVQKTVSSNMFYFSDKPGEFDKSELPEVLVDIFKLILELSESVDEEMEKVRNILFELFKSLFADLDLDSIVNMNRSLIENKPKKVLRVNQNKRLGPTMVSAMDDQMEARFQSNPNLILVRLSCFQEIVSILKTKAAIVKNDDRVLMMFEGIVESILRDLYDSSEIITEKIYNLLEEILIIRADMEEMVCRSLFRCIKSRYHYMRQEKTQEFIQLVLNKINPKVFINVLVQYIDERFYVDNHKSQESRRVMNEIVNYITVILTYYENRDFIINDLIFSNDRNMEVVQLWCMCPSALIKAGLFCKLFDFAVLVLEKETEMRCNDENRLLMLAKGSEDMLAMIDTFKFNQVMRSVKNPAIKEKVVKLAATLAMVAHNNKRWVEVVKKLKLEYSYSQELTAEQMREVEEYEERNQHLFSIYDNFTKMEYTPMSATIMSARTRKTNKWAKDQRSST